MVNYTGTMFNDSSHCNLFVNISYNLLGDFISIFIQVLPSGRRIINAVNHLLIYRTADYLLFFVLYAATAKK